MDHTTNSSSHDRSLRSRRWTRRLSGVLAGSAALVLAPSGWALASSTVSSRASSTPLYLLSSEGYDSAMCTAFQKATGITCKLSDNSTGPTLALIQATKGNPQWGVAWTDGAAPYAALDNEGLLLRHFEPTTGHLTTLGKKLVPADGSYIPTGLTVSGAFMYNTKVVKNPPKTWAALLSPEWRGQIEMNNPAVDGPTYPMLAGLFQSLGGVAQGEKFMEKLKANGLKVSSNNAFPDLQAGKVKIVLGQNTDGIGAFDQGQSIADVYPNPSPELPSTLAIDGKASKAEIAVAKKFADFVYSPAGQAVMRTGDPSGDSNFFPIIAGTAPRPHVPAVTSVPFEFYNPYTWGALEPSINTWFSSHIA